MSPFYINAFLILFIDALVFTFVKDDRKRRKYICLLNTLQIILFIALRGETVGNDTQNYVNYFRQVASNPPIAFLKKEYEIGFRWYVYLIAKVTENPRVFLAIGAFVSFAPFGVLIYKYSKDCVLSFYTFCTMEFILFAMTGMRQNVAYLFVYSSYMLFQSDKKGTKILSLILIFVGGFFHKSAWAFIILYAMTFIKTAEMKKNIYVIGIICAFIFRNQIGRILVNSFYDAYTLNSTGAYSRVFMVGIVLTICICFYNVIEVQSENDITYADKVVLFPKLVDAMFLTTFLAVIALSISAAARQARYFFVFIILVLPELQYIIVKEQRRIFKMICYILLTLIMFYLFPHNGLCTSGYIFMWGGVKSKIPNWNRICEVLKNRFTYLFSLKNNSIPFGNYQNGRECIIYG